MEDKERKELKGQVLRHLQDHKEHRVRQEKPQEQDHKVHKVLQEVKDHKVLKDHKVHKELKGR